MNRFALTSLYRSLTRHKLYAALNIGGLAVGIAVFIVLGLYVRFETSYEQWLPGHDAIYQIQSDWNVPGSPLDGVARQTPGGMLDMLREDFPGVRGTRIMPSFGSVVRNGVGTSEAIAPVDPEFLDLFQINLLSGSRDALSDPQTMVLTQDVAERYFSQGDPIGQTLAVLRNGELTNYTVGAIVQNLPANTDFDFTILVPFRPSTSPEEIAFDRNLGALSASTYLQFATPSDAQAFEQQMGSFVDRHGRDLGDDPSGTLGYKLTPIADLHLASGTNDSLRLTVATLGIVGLVTLLIALVNYVNLATARAALRAREVAMRKVLGADRAAVMRQFLSEAVLTVAIAALAGLILAELGLPIINAAGGLDLAIPYGVVVPALVMLSIVAGLAGGFYPALVLSRFHPAAVLASSRSPGGGKGGTRVREALVVFQFGLSIAFMVGTAVLFAQTDYLRNADIGFDREGLMVVSSYNNGSLDDAAKATLLARFAAIPQVSNVTKATMAAGGSGSNSAENLPIPGVPGDGPTLTKIEVGDDFFTTYGIGTVAGRVFSRQYGADDATTTEDTGGFNIVVSRNAVSALGFASASEAIGQTVGGSRPRTIVGVVENTQYQSPRIEIRPTFYVYKSELPDYAIPTLRFSGDPGAVREAVGAAWEGTAGSVPLRAETADERLSEYYQRDEQTARLFAIGTALAVLIGMVGLWGLAFFNTARRVKEIGIRKSLGASAFDVVKLLVGQFLRPVLIANLIAWPLAYFAMQTWLAGFPDRIALSPVFFVSASLLAIAIAVLTVLGQSLRASRTPPAWALRHD